MTRTLTCLALLALAACSQESPAPSETATPVASPAATGTPAATPRQASLIPERFLGIWDVQGGNCEPGSDLRVEIAERGVTFYESHGAVTGVVIESPSSVVVDLAMQGEGDKWTVKRRFTLGEDGRTLTPEAVDDEQYTLIPRQRCN